MRETTLNVNLLLSLIITLAAGAASSCGDDASSSNRVPTVEPLQFVTLPGRTSEQTAQASDPDGDPITFSLSGDSAFGELSLVEGTPGRLRFAAGQALGQDTVTLVVEDDRGGRTEAAVTLRVVEDRPIADPQTVRVREDEMVTLHLVGLDPRGTPVDFAITDRPTNGRLEAQEPLDQGRFIYRPSMNYHGADEFTFEARDPERRQRRSDPAKVSIVVEPVNDAPTTSNQSFSTPEDTPLEAEVRAFDVDEDPLSFELVRDVRDGALTLGADGTFRYVPAPDWNGRDAFQFRVSDGSLRSEVATATITVRAVNDAPVVRAVSVSTSEGTPVVIQVEALDVDGDAIELRLASDPTLGHAEVLNPALGHVLYQPRAGELGADTFTVRASDGQLSSEPATVEVQIIARSGPVSAPGLPDPGFGASGRALFPASPDMGYAVGRGLFPQPGGFILFGDSSTGLRRRPTLLEIDEAGALVTSGWPDGLVRAYAQVTSEILSVTRDAAGRFLVATLAPAYGDLHPVLLRRLRPDGALDTSFGFGGVVELNSAGEQPLYVVEDHQNRVVVAATFNLSSRSVLYVTRLLEDGTLDPSFIDPAAGQPGVRTLAEASTGKTENQVRGLHVESSGRILVVNQARSGSFVSSMETQVVALEDGVEPVILTRLLTLDYTAQSQFTSDGLLHLAGHQGLGNALLARVNLATDTSSVVDLTARCGTPQSSRKVLQVDDTGARIVAHQSSGAWNLCRVLPNGGVDSGFTSITTAALVGTFDDPDSSLRAIDPAPEGGWLLSGSTPRAGGPFHDWTVVRLSASGELVPSWGAQGVLRVTLGSGNDIVFAQDTGPDGKTSLLVRSEESVVFGQQRRFSVLRADTSGQVDTSFAGGEPVTLPFEHDSSYPSGAVGVDSSGGTWVLARRRAGAGALVRFQPSGALDLAVGTDGVLNVPSLSTSPLVIDGSDRLLYFSTLGPSVARLLPSGAADTGFGENGRAVLIESDNSNVTLHDLAVAADGGLAVVLYSPSGPELRVLRRDASGAPVTSFGASGVFAETIPRPPEWSRARVRFDATGRVVVAMYIDEEEAERHLVFRLTANGSLDSSFGSGGRMILEGRALSSTTLAVDRLNRPLLTLFSGVGSSVVRLNSVGALDASFGAGGLTPVLSREAGSVNLRVGQLSVGDGLHTLGLGPDGESVLAGGTLDGEAFLSRLLP